MALISDRKPDALLELGNRSDIDTGAPSRLDKWYRDSYIELAMNVPLETLEGSQESLFDPSSDTYTIPLAGRLPKCISVNTTGANGFTPGTAQSIVTLDYKDIRYIRQMSSQAPGPPSVYCLFQGKVIIRPVPDKEYSVMWDVWTPPVISNPIADTPLLVPADWLEIVDMGALMRGFKALLERDKARELQELLYGFKTPAGKVVPGYITYRQTQIQAGSEYQEYGLQPRGRRYTA